MSVFYSALNALSEYTYSYISKNKMAHYFKEWTTPSGVLKNRDFGASKWFS